MTDQELLERFRTTRDEQAFAELVRRYIGLVYASARRQIKDASIAEDVTQSVFVLLSQKANTIRNAVAISGWLLVTTRGVALNAIRAQARRTHHESEAAVMKQERQAQIEPAWDSIAPHLDEAIATLHVDERDALTLRYFRNQDLNDVAAALGISEPAARKRVQRAVERLRRFFASRGILTSADALGALLPAHALMPVPSAALSTQIAHAAIATAQTIANATSTGTAIGAALAMTGTKTILTIACIFAALVVGVVGTVAYLAPPGNQPTQAAAPAVLAASTSQPTETWQDRFNRDYALNPGEAIKHVAAPFAPERSEYCRVQRLVQDMQGIPRDPDMIVFESDGSKLQIIGSVFGAQTLRNVLNPVAHLLPAQTDLSPDILDMPVTGDWVVRKGATQAERIDGISTQLAHIFGPGMTLKPVLIEREAIVVRRNDGTATTKPTNPARALSVLFARDEANAAAGPGHRGKLSEMMMSLGEHLQMPVVLETDDLSQAVNWTVDPSVDSRRSPNPPNVAVIDEILAAVSRQTSLTLRRDRRAVTVWQLAPK